MSNYRNTYCKDCKAFKQFNNNLRGKCDVYNIRVRLDNFSCSKINLRNELRGCEEYMTGGYIVIDKDLETSKFRIMGKIKTLLK